MKILVWGTGKIASLFMKKEKGNGEIIGFIESKKTKTKTVFCGKSVYEPQELSTHDVEYDYIIVCVLNNSRNIERACKEYNIPLTKVLFLITLNGRRGEICRVSPKSVQPKLVQPILSTPIPYELEIRYPWLCEQVRNKQIQAERYTIICRNGYDLVEKNDLFQGEEFNTWDYQLDYFRYRTFELVANEIINGHIEGAVAEVGVFRGAFSKLINAKFPDRFLEGVKKAVTLYESEINHRLCKVPLADEGGTLVIVKC